MADELDRRPVLNPVLRFTKDARPEGIVGGGKSATGIQRTRLERQRRVLSQGFRTLADTSDDQPQFAKHAIIYAAMFDDSLAPTWTPNDLFRPDRGAQLLAPFLDGYLIEVEVGYLPRLSRLAETASSARDLVDISRVRDVRFHQPTDALNGKSLEDVWADAPETADGRLFLVWFMPLSSGNAAEQVLQTIDGLRGEVIRDGPALLARPVDATTQGSLDRALRTLSTTNRLGRAMREYRQHRHARTSLVVPSLNALDALTCSGAVYRLEAVSPLTVTTPGRGREPDRPLPENLENEPVVGVVDGGLNASSYLPAEAWRAPALVSGSAAEVLHGNRITSIVVQGHDWNNNLVLPELYCRVGTVPAIAKPGHPSPDPEEFVAYLDALIGAHPNTKVWNLSFNQGRECGGCSKLPRPRPLRDRPETWHSVREFDWQQAGILFEGAS